MHAADPPHTSDLELASVSSVEELARVLRVLRIRAGKVPLRRLEVATKFKRVPLSRSTLSDMLAGRRLPSKAIVLAFVEECGISGVGLVEWRLAWERAASAAEFPAVANIETSGMGVVTAPLVTYESFGLVGMEVRGSEFHSVPPGRFIREASSEVVISGVTAKSTLTLLARDLDHILSRGVCVGVLILHPRSDDVARLRQQELIDVGAELEEVEALLRGKYTVSYGSSFYYRFLRNIPPFTAIMRDGALLTRATGVAEDGASLIRVQPRSAHHSQHRGVVFTFRSGHADAASAFNFFADDLRLQWEQGLRP
ncbi:helix-turn-helix domain-containing protein [Actinocorallia sp. API 0066]|uniref:helix-turn-helix domain-containing protein n=1 Tax=Actinocorallia sp. API 0066 TaxID=2896846 RepID=UPI001E375C6C|nr:helix-turn-helix transcriptional regulator [Actinocorallia sp. API 0066]MCD0451932.1 helix-turn-helix domain-containing protein [Actinocorallia sp. API 0066]